MRQKIRLVYLGGPGGRPGDASKGVAEVVGLARQKYACLLKSFASLGKKEKGLSQQKSGGCVTIKDIAVGASRKRAAAW